MVDEVDTKVIKDCLGEIERELEGARDAARQIEADTLNQPCPGGFEDAEGALSYSLTRVYEIVLLTLEAGGLGDTRSRFLDKWAAFVKKGFGKMDQISEDSLISEPLDYIESILVGLRAVVGEGLNSAEAFELGKLLSILGKTGWILRKRKIVPSNEKDVRDVMHDYLDAFFSDYTKNVSIAKPIKTFKPDGGVIGLKAAIEFKYAGSEKEVKDRLGELYEDMIGYSGSADWTRCYTVMFQTDHFVADDRFHAAVSRGGNTVWRPILVTGRGDRKPKSAMKASLKRT